MKQRIIQATVEACTKNCNKMTTFTWRIRYAAQLREVDIFILSMRYAVQSSYAMAGERSSQGPMGDVIMLEYDDWHHCDVTKRLDVYNITRKANLGIWLFSQFPASEAVNFHLQENKKLTDNTITMSDPHPQGGDLFDMAKDGTKGENLPPPFHPTQWS